MIQGIQTVAWLGASALFILSLGGLAHPETARRGNTLGIVGMALAVLATALSLLTGWMDGTVGAANLGVLAGGLIGGGLIGASLASRVAMTSMPQLVAILHSFVGLAAVGVGYGSLYDPHTASLTGAEAALHHAELWIGVLVGAVTFSGSVVAWGKLEGKIASRPLLLPARHALNAGVLLAALGLMIPFFLASPPTAALWALLGMTALALFLGWHMVMAIGGADMPVVVSMLNSYSGWAAAAAGFLLNNDLLIVTGALVGSSGAILSYIMCKAMNRSFLSVIFGGFGADEGKAPAKAVATDGREPIAMEVAELAEALKAARSVIVVPGYGMAVAQAQHPIRALTEALRKRGAVVRFAIHPVAGRLPGHMNVLLAEAAVPYDLVLEMDEINADFPDTDVVLVVGANDIVNPGALDDPSSPIYGMPVLHAWEARRVVVSKRGRGAGYAGVENPLFLHESCRMLYGDARKSMEALLQALQQG